MSEISNLLQTLGGEEKPVDPRFASQNISYKTASPMYRLHDPWVCTIINM